MTDPSGHDGLDSMANLSSVCFATICFDVFLAQVGNPAVAAAAQPSLRTIYYIVDPFNCPSSFDSSEIQRIQKMLQSQLSAKVFNNLKAGQSVKIRILKSVNSLGVLGWNAQNTIYVNRVEFGWNNVPFSGYAMNNHGGGIWINLNKIEYNPIPSQLMVNYFAHE
jgi:hypothetical protein